MKEVLAFNFGKISVEEAKRIAIETNETRFDNDPLKIAKLFSDIKDTFKISELNTTIPYSLEEINNYIKMLDFD